MQQIPGKSYTFPENSPIFFLIFNYFLILPQAVGNSTDSSGDQNFSNTNDLVVIPKKSIKALKNRENVPQRLGRYVLPTFPHILWVKRAVSR
jgi:hypothetical protein